MSRPINDSSHVRAPSERSTARNVRSQSDLGPIILDWEAPHDGGDDPRMARRGRGIGFMGLRSDQTSVAGVGRAQPNSVAQCRSLGGSGSDNSVRRAVTLNPAHLIPAHGDTSLDNSRRTILLDRGSDPHHSASVGASRLTSTSLPFSTCTSSPPGEPCNWPLRPSKMCCPDLSMESPLKNAPGGAVAIIASGSKFARLNTRAMLERRSPVGV